MKEKTIERLVPIKTRKKGLIGTIQSLDDIYIINIFFDKQLHYKYCIDVRTKEYKTLDVMSGIWSQKKILSMVDGGYSPGAYWRTPKPEIRFDSDTDELLNKINESMTVYKRSKDIVMALDNYELESGREKRQIFLNNKSQRIYEMELRTPKVDEEKISDWAIKMINPIHYLLKTKEGCSCTSCGSRFESKAKRGQTEECPQCKALLKVKNIKPESIISVTGMISIIQATDFETLIRHIDCEVTDSFGEKRDISFNESVRVNIDKYKKKGQLIERTNLYYAQINKRDYYSRHFNHRSLNAVPSLYDSNPCNRHIISGFLYPEGIENLDRTSYSNITNLLKYMAGQGIKANYNRIMYAGDIEDVTNTIEYLSKGRFYRLVTEASENISMYHKTFDSYYVSIQPGEDIHETLGLQDRQLINRLRDKNGGSDMLRILQWVDEEGLKLPDEALTFFEKQKVRSKDLMRLTEKINITPLAIMNYLIKQKKTCYQSKTYQGILDQWIDYLSMMDRLDKRYTEELFYKPKNLKQRHDELVEEVNARQRELELKDNQKIAKQQAKEYKEKFPKAEKILKDIKPKFEYSGEQMSIIVPLKLSDIIADGKTLHHCAGATNRYFDRIENKETFICFLRKNDNIEIPFYTIEVEPGGTIRQHRGMYDEEPELETVKPFLKEWQKEIKKRMNREDKKLAKISKIKREANIEDLKARNNTFVLKGLMEDFMEA